MSTRSYEEISVCWAILWLQVQLLRYGISSGSLVIETYSGDDFVDSCEMNHLAKLYEHHLQSNEFSASSALREMLSHQDDPHHFRAFMFDWTILHLMTSTLKTPPQHEHDNGGLLNVHTSTLDDPFVDDAGDYVLQSASRSQIHQTLSRDFHIRDATLADIVMCTLHTLGFLECRTFPNHAVNSLRHLLRDYTSCSFPMPLGLDNSALVETLVAAVEVCLKSLDLSVNETGFLLLLRKLWPSEQASQYALSRLARSVLEWILAEVR